MCSCKVNLTTCFWSVIISSECPILLRNLLTFFLSLLLRDFPNGLLKADKITAFLHSSAPAFNPFCAVGINPFVLCRGLGLLLPDLLRSDDPPVGQQWRATCRWDWLDKNYPFLQSSGSESGSTCFWASRIRIHLSEVRIRIRSFYHQAKIVRKTYESYCFVTSFGLFIFEK